MVPKTSLLLLVLAILILVPTTTAITQENDIAVEKTATAKPVGNATKSAEDPTRMNQTSEPMNATARTFAFRYASVEEAKNGSATSSTPKSAASAVKTGNRTRKVMRRRARSFRFKEPVVVDTDKDAKLKKKTGKPARC